MSQIVKSGSIQLDEPQIVPAGSFELDKESDVGGGVLRTASGLAHTARAVAETGAGLVTGLAAFPISKGTKWIEYALSGGDLEKAKAAEQRANERIQFAPTTPEAQGALEKLGKYALDPVFKTLREAGRIPGEAWNSPTMMELGGDVAEIGGPIKLHGMLKTQRAYRSGKPVTEIIEPKAPEVAPKPIEKPVIVKAKSIELDKPEVKIEPLTEGEKDIVYGRKGVIKEDEVEWVDGNLTYVPKEPKIIPAESIKLDAPEVKAEVKPVETVAAVKPKTISPTTSDTTTRFNIAGVDDTFEITNKTGSSINGYLKNQDFPGEKVKADRGELFLTQVKESQRRQGIGQSLNEDAIRLMYANGTKTVNLHATSVGGESIVKNLINRGYISEPIKTSSAGKTEHIIFPKKPKADLPSVETVTPPVEKPVVAREDVTKSIYEKENPLAINDPLYDALEALTNKSNRRGYNPDLLTEDNIAQLKKNGFVVGGAKSLKVTVKGRSYLDEVGKKKTEIDTAFANEQDILADKAVEAFDKAQVQAPAPVKETKVIPTTKKAEANVTSPKEQKKYLINAIDEALKDASDEPMAVTYHRTRKKGATLDWQEYSQMYGKDYYANKEKFGTVRIEVPNDGTFTIINTKQALNEFKEQTKSFPASVIKGAKEGKSPQASKEPSGKRIELDEVSYYNEFKPRKQDIIAHKGDDFIRNRYVGGYFTNGHYAVKTEKPIAKDVKLNTEAPLPDIKKVIPSSDGYSPAKIVAEFHEGRGEYEKASVHLVGENGFEVGANAHYVDVILTKHPDAKVFVSEGMRPIVFKKGKEVVGLVMPLKDALPSKEFINEFRPPIKSEPKGVQLNSGLDPTIAIDIMKTISAKTSEIIEANKMTPSVARGVKAGKDAMIEQDRNVRRAESTSKLFEKTVQDIVPKPERQMDMVHAYEHKMKGKAWEGLTEIEKGVVRWAAEEKAKLNKYIKDNDILETMPESDSINHIFHHWIDKETGKPYKAMYGKFSKGLPQAKQRVIPTYEAGIKNGMTPATTNIGKLIGMEWEAATRANNARQLFKKLHGIKGDESMSIVLSKGGKPQPIRMVESWSNLEKQGLTDGYVRYDNNFLDKSMTFESSDGRLITMKGAVGIKEELYPFVHSYIDSPQYGKLSDLNFASKSLTLGASLFHPVSLGMQELANLRTPFVHIPQGIRLIKELGPEVRLLHQEGLELFKGYEDLGFKNQFFDDGSTLGKTGNAITWPITKMRDFIFDYVQPGMKVSFAHAMFTKMLPKYLEGTKFTSEEVMAMYESGKPLPPEALKCAREVVQKADGHFSGEHYKRSLLETNRFMVKLYFTPEARVKWQAALLSPTWQREHLLVAKNVAKSFMPDKMIKKLGMAELGPIKSQYQRYALGAAMIIGAVDLWNYNSSLIMDGDGKHLWQNPKGKGFSVRAWWNEPAYTMKTKNGQDRYIPSAPAYIRPLKSVFEVAEWAHDPVLKLGYKLSPVLSAIGEQLFGQKKYVGLPDIPERALDFIVDSTTPIVVDQGIRTAQGKQSIQATALPFVGMPVSRLKQMNYKSNPEGN